MANTTPTGPKGFPIPKPPASGATAQDSVTVHVLGFDQITRENFRVKLQAQAALTGGRDAEGLPLGFFLLTLQGLSELVKRIALLRGEKPAAEVVVEYHRPEQ